MGIGAVVLLGETPDDELGGAASIEVYECMGQSTTYRIRYALDITDGDLPFLKDGRIGPGSTLAVAVSVGGQVSCLVKGPVYAQQLHLAHGGAGSWVDVMGADTSLAMDREDKASVWSDVTDSDAVSTIVGQYALTPDVESTTPMHPETKHTLVQRETDLAFVRRLARRNGFLFWVTCDENGVETAHFKRAPLDGEPAVELKINLDQPSVDALEIAWDVERPTAANAEQVDLNTKSAIDGNVPSSPLTLLGGTGLGEIASGIRTLHLAAPVDDAGDLTARGEAALIEAGFFVRATCTTSVSAVGKMIRAHTLVKLRGAGSRHSGTYFCAAVKHSIDSLAHRMDLELIRNGWGG